MKHLGLLVFLVLALAICEAHASRVISPNLGAQPTSRDFAALRKPVTLSYSQKQALVLAYRAGNHYGIGLLYAAVIWRESKLCKFAVGDHGKAHGCAQLHESAVEAVTGRKVAAWKLQMDVFDDVNLAIGARYLDLCLQRFGYPRGISCYNTGMPCAAQPKCKPRVKRAYTRAVLVNMKMLEQLPQEED